MAYLHYLPTLPEVDSDTSSKSLYTYHSMIVTCYHLSSYGKPPQQCYHGTMPGGQRKGT